ncbi:uncharacterized protein LOC108739326 [Agrilus planipennis]|uniref:Uncharacterized protein LOC108739326 n=1 Tax=Agrilus planipennis TaxID=224129 RepID=A0A7F5RFR9_AGRPL|nr:uncharacterized protein LOC108739326 [Agrilus planipennis]
MALGLCKICCDIAKNLYKKPISLSQKVISCKFIHDNGLRNDDASDLRKIVSETVIKLSRPNINPFESDTLYAKELETQDSPISNSESSQAASTSAFNCNVAKHYKRIIEIQPTPLQRYWSSGPPHKDNSVVRYYSSNKKNTNKCKKDNEKCRKMIAPCCDPPARKSCKPPLDDSTCCKQEAPYPSYSEKCVEEVIDKPSECKLCPWTPDKHPYFEYVDEFPHFRHPKKPRKQQNDCKTRKFSTQVSTTNESTFKNGSSGSVLTTNENEIFNICSTMKLDKKPCKPPPPKCKPEPPKCNKDKKEKKPEKRKQDDCKKKCSNMNKEEYMLDSSFHVEMGLRNKSKNECVKKGKIRKFPFPNPPPIKQIDTDTPCPKRKIKSPIKDCPTGGGCSECLPNTILKPNPLHLHSIIDSDQSTNEGEPFPSLVEERAISLATLQHQLYLEEDNKCPPTHEKSKVCPKESLILPKRKKVKRPPLCSEKEGNKKGK